MLTTILILLILAFLASILAITSIILYTMINNVKNFKKLLKASINEDGIIIASPNRVRRGDKTNAETNKG